MAMRQWRRGLTKLRTGLSDAFARRVPPAGLTALNGPENPPVRQCPDPAMPALVARLPALWNGPSPLTLRRVLPVLGPGYIVAIGYIDAGNWATDVDAGARYGFALLSVVVAASLAGAFLQALAVRLTLASGSDLARLIRERLPRPAIVTDPNMLCLSIGIIGATIMPHNLYLHSGLARGRAAELHESGQFRMDPDERGECNPGLTHHPHLRGPWSGLWKGWRGPGQPPVNGRCHQAGGQASR